jgi:hypothetical protein
MLNNALALARLGFHVFPLAPGRKDRPLIKGFPERASINEAQLRKWWAKWPDANIGASTSFFRGGPGALLVVDVDVKAGPVADTILRVELEHGALPLTLEVATPSGGRHLFYRVDAPVKQGVDVLGRGVDIRSKGGYVVGMGSVTEKGEYMLEAPYEIAPAPQWLIDACGQAPEREAPATAAPQLSDAELAYARERAADYLFAAGTPVAIEGEGGDATTFKVACRLRDFGLPLDEAYVLMLQWNELCQPAWDPDALELKVRNAYAYAKEPAGNDNVLAMFDEVTPPAPPAPGEPPLPVSPLAQLNEQFAYLVDQDVVLWETTDDKGRAVAKHLTVSSFGRKFASKTLQVGKRTEPLTDVWLRWTGRRTFDSVVFDPSAAAPPRFYNLWRGFSVAPAPDLHSDERAARALDMFTEHAFKNVCRGSQPLFDWLMGYFAHMVQRPAEKPLVALVFRGGKGVGKNALIERVGALIGSHFLLTSEERYLTGNFNAHLENLLMFALDEAFWSGNKRAEGVLKGLITGTDHVIERKGQEPYRVANLTRIAIIGNEDWLVPASADERRFAVFDVGDGRKRDKQFFLSMREGMESGGYALLLRYLLDFDLTGIDVNEAPETAALLDQKIASLDPVYQWWYDCLREDRLIGSTFDSPGLPRVVKADDLRAAYKAYLRGRHMTGRVCSDTEFGRRMAKVNPTQEKTKRDKQPAFRWKETAALRTAWDSFIGHETVWPDDSAS